MQQVLYMHLACAVNFSCMRRIVSFVCFLLSENDYSQTKWWYMKKHCIFQQAVTISELFTQIVIKINHRCLS